MGGRAPFGSSRRLKVFNFIGIFNASLFVIILSYFTVLQVQSYNYTVFDLGLVYRLMYLFYHNHTVIFYGNGIIYNPIPFSKLIFIPLSLIFFIQNNLYMPLIIQIFTLGIGGVALFKITHIKTNNWTAAIVIEIVYFLYPATYGFMANGANFMGYVEPFLIIGYLFLLRRKFVLSFLFFFTASISNTWAPLIVVVFLITDLFSTTNIRLIFERIKKFGFIVTGSQMFIDYKNRILFLTFTFLLLITTLSIVILMEGGISKALSDSRFATGGGSSLTVVSSSLLNQYLNGLSTVKLPFFVNALSPFLYTPVLTLYSIPFFLYNLLIWGLNPTSAGSYFILDQHYSYLFAPFLFIGSVHFIGKFSRGKHKSELLKKLMILMLISSLVSFMLYSPFSAINFQDGTVKQLSTVTPLDKELTYGLNLIPINSTVFIQNDLPQLMNREQVYMPGYYNNQTVDYAIIAPFGFSQISSEYGGYSPYWANQFSTNSSYGVYEDICGITVYKLGYVSNPAYFVPVNKTILPGYFGLNPINSGINKNGTIFVPRISNNETFFSGGFTNFYPGTYKITFSINAYNLSKNNKIHLCVLKNNGNNTTYFGNLNINGSNFQTAGKYKNFTVNLHFINYNQGVGLEFLGVVTQYSGNFSLRWINIEQIN